MKFYTTTYSSYIDGVMYNETKAARTQEDAQKIFDNYIRDIAEEHSEYESEVLDFLGNSHCAWGCYDDGFECAVNIEEHTI